MQRSFRSRPIPSSSTVWTFKAEVVADSDIENKDKSDGVTVTAYVLCGTP